MWDTECDIPVPAILLLFGWHRYQKIWSRKKVPVSVPEKIGTLEFQGTKTKTETKTKTQFYALLGLNIFQGEYFSGVNIFQEWIFFRGDYFSEVNILRGEYVQEWIFFRGEYFSGLNIVQGDYFSGVNIFQGWIFFREDHFSRMNIFYGWIFFRVN